MGHPAASDREIGLHLFLPPGEMTDALQAVRALGRAAAAAGFDLVSVGEHHGDTPGYLPTPWPLLASLLAEHDNLRTGAYPVLAGLREPAMLVEECEVGCAVFPGRLQVAVGVGYRELDFKFCGADLADARRRFDEVFTLFRIREEQGVCTCGELLVAGGGLQAQATALATGSGLLLPPLAPSDEARTIARYRDAGGTGSVVVQRWLAVGAADAAAYRSLRAPWAPASLTPSSTGELADVLGRALAATGTGGVSIRIGGPLTDPGAVTAWIERCGDAIRFLGPTVSAP